MGPPAQPNASTWLSPLHALLDRPRFYALTWRVAAPGAHRVLLARIETELATAPAGRTLDVGCGPRSWLQGAGVSPVGVDATFGYAQALRRSGGVALVARAEALPFRTGSFGSAWSFGLLHHVSDEHARVAVAELLRVAQAGRIVVFDGVLPRLGIHRPLAWALRRLDRGVFMRGETALRALISAAPIEPRQAASSAAAWRVSRFTYSWTGLEGLWCVLG